MSRQALLVPLLPECGPCPPSSSPTGFGTSLQLSLLKDITGAIELFHITKLGERPPRSEQDPMSSSIYKITPKPIYVNNRRTRTVIKALIEPNNSRTQSKCRNHLSTQTPTPSNSKPTNRSIPAQMAKPKTSQQQSPTAVERSPPSKRLAFGAWSLRLTTIPRRSWHTCAATMR